MPPTTPKPRKPRTPKPKAPDPLPSDDDDVTPQLPLTSPTNPRNQSNLSTSQPPTHNPPPPPPIKIPMTLRTTANRQTFIDFIFTQPHEPLTTDNLPDSCLARWAPYESTINHNAIIRHFRNDYSVKPFLNITADTREHRSISNFLNITLPPTTDLTKSALPPTSFVSILSALDFIYFLIRIRAPTDANTIPHITHSLSTVTQTASPDNSPFLADLFARHNFHRTRFPKSKPTTWTLPTQKRIGQILSRGYLFYAEAKPVTTWLWSLIAITQTSAEEQLTEYSTEHVPPALSPAPLTSPSPYPLNQAPQTNTQHPRPTPPDTQHPHFPRNEHPPQPQKPQIKLTPTATRKAQLSIDIATLQSVISPHSHRR